MKNYKGYGYQPITTPIKWDCDVLREGFVISHEGNAITVAHPVEDPKNVIDDLYRHANPAIEVSKIESILGKFYSGEDSAMIALDAIASLIN